MQQRYYWTIGIVVLVIIAWVIWINFMHNQSGSLMALSPYMEFEGTIISLSLDESGNYYEDGELVDAPKDSAVVRIDRIIETGGSYSFDWTSLGIEEGKEVTLDFKYTARPTKIITVGGETTQDGDAVSHQIVPTKITFENGYFIFRVNGNSGTEKILLGLQEGSKFKTKLWKTFEVKLEEYQIIP